MKYKSLKIIVLAVFVLLTAVLIKPTNVSAGCYAQNPTWTPSSVPWSKVAIPVTLISVRLVITFLMTLVLIQQILLLVVVLRQQLMVQSVMLVD